MKNLIATLAILCLSYSFPAHAEFKIWEGMSGNVIEAEFVTVLGNEAVLKKRDGKTVKVPISKLCEKDQHYINSGAKSTSSSGKTDSGKAWRSMPLDKLKTKARDGDAEAQLELGRRYDEADGGIDKVNAGHAFRWYKKAARQGLAEAQWRTANAYSSGRGVSRNEKYADEWYWAVEEQGHLEARLYLLRRMYDMRSVWSQKKLEQLFNWCREEAEKGSAEACFILAECYLLDDLFLKTKPDPKEALVWLRKALEYGHKDYEVYEKIGDAYYQQEDFVMALRWYLDAAHRYDSLFGTKNVLFFGIETKGALYQKISRMYRKGIGTTKNSQTAREWGKKAKAEYGKAFSVGGWELDLDFSGLDLF